MWLINSGGFILDINFRTPISLYESSKQTNAVKKGFLLMRSTLVKDERIRNILQMRANEPVK